MIAGRRHPLARIAPLLLAVVLPWIAACGATAKPSPSPGAVATAESESREITIDAPLGETPEKGDADQGDVALNGHVFGSGATGVILVHMRPSDQTAWFPFAIRLAALGKFTVMTFDFRGFGASTGEKDFDQLDTDLEAAYAYMRDELGVSRIFLVGASMGGTASLVVGANNPVAGVASISSFAQFQMLDALGSVGAIKAPKLFITSKDDVPAVRSQEQMWDAATGPKEQQVYDGNVHGTDILQGPDGDDLQRRLVDFLTSN